MCRATDDTGLPGAGSIVATLPLGLSGPAQAATTSAAVAAPVAISNDGVPVEGLPAATAPRLADNGTVAVLDGGVVAVPAVVAGLEIGGVVPERLDDVVLELHPDLYTGLGVRPRGPAFPFTPDEGGALGPRIKRLALGCD